MIDNRKLTYNERLLLNSLLDTIHDIPDIIIGYVWAGWEAHADFEDGFADAIDVGWGSFVDRLLVHRFPYWASLYL